MVETFDGHHFHGWKQAMNVPAVLKQWRISHGAGACMSHVFLKRAAALLPPPSQTSK